MPIDDWQQPELLRELEWESPASDWTYICMKYFDNHDHHDSDIGCGDDKGDNNHILIKMGAMMMMMAMKMMAMMMMIASWQQCLKSNCGRTCTQWAAKFAELPAAYISCLRRSSWWWSLCECDDKQWWKKWKRSLGIWLFQQALQNMLSCWVT